MRIYQFTIECRACGHCARYAYSFIMLLALRIISLFCSLFFRSWCVWHFRIRNDRAKRIQHINIIWGMPAISVPKDISHVAPAIVSGCGQFWRHRRETSERSAELQPPSELCKWSIKNRRIRYSNCHPDCEQTNRQIRLQSTTLQYGGTTSHAWRSNETMLINFCYFLIKQCSLSFYQSHFVEWP